MRSYLIIAHLFYGAKTKAEVWSITSLLFALQAIIFFYFGIIPKSRGLSIPKNGSDFSSNLGEPFDYSDHDPKQLTGDEKE